MVHLDHSVVGPARRRTRSAFLKPTLAFGGSYFLFECLVVFIRISQVLSPSLWLIGTSRYMPSAVVNMIHLLLLTGPAITGILPAVRPPALFLPQTFIPILPSRLYPTLGSLSHSFRFHCEFLLDGNGRYHDEPTDLHLYGIDPWLFGAHAFELEHIRDSTKDACWSTNRSHSRNFKELVRMILNKPWQKHQPSSHPQRHSSDVLQPNTKAIFVSLLLTLRMTCAS